MHERCAARRNARYSYVRIKERRRNRKRKQRAILQTNDNRMTWPSTRWDICRLLYVYRVAQALRNYTAGTFSRQERVQGSCTMWKSQGDAATRWNFIVTVLQIVIAACAVYGGSVSRKYAYPMTSRSKCISRRCGYKLSKFRPHLGGWVASARLYRDRDVNVSHFNFSTYP